MAEHFDPKALAAALRPLLPASGLVVDAAACDAWASDALTAKRQRPPVVALPDTVAQVQAVVRWCAAHDVPLVGRGAGTGLSGGATPHAEGVLLSLARFNRLLQIDPLARTARVEPGVRNLAVSEAAAAHGLYYAPDPSSQIACSIGGNVAENAGGVHCLKYGLTVHNVLGLTVVLPDGDLLDLVPGDGMDLLALLHGSEGKLGLVVEARLRLLPTPGEARVLLAAFDTVAGAADAVASLIGAGVVPAGLEMMDRLAVQAAEDFVQAGYPRDAAAILLCELDGTAAEVAAQAAQVQAMLLDAGASTVRASADEAERQRFWLGRKAAFPAVGRLAPDYFCMDGTIPRHRLAQVLETIASLAGQHGLQVANVFHAGDGNLHPLILFDANVPGQQAQAEALGARILEACIAVGGTITGEHGVGLEKIDQMCVQFNAAELAQMHRLQAAFDPAGIMNPGKAVPSLARCGELGGMHVRGGALPFPELERF